jgi:hypothetical protein
MFLPECERPISHLYTTTGKVIVLDLKFMVKKARGY